VPELRKPEGKTCEFCDHGCTVYPDRPPSCRAFQCEWLKGELPLWARPDKIHVMIEKLPVVPVAIALPEPGHEATWPTPRVIDVLKDRYQARGVAVITRQGDTRYALVPEGKTEDDVIDAFRLGAAVALGMKATG
jgi:hypothetical protein